MKNMKLSKKISFFYLWILALALLLWILWGGDQDLKLNSDTVMISPNFSFWFGTDSLGRDYVYRLLAGGVLTLKLTLLSTTSALFIALMIGFLSGWFEGWMPRTLFRLMDFIQSVPSLALAAVLFLFLQNSFQNQSAESISYWSLFLSLVMTQWVGPARWLRAEIIQIRYEPFIEASRSLGASSYQALKFHLVPALKPSLFLLFGLELPKHIFFESFLSFIGFGFQPPLSSWGSLVQEGWKYLSTAPHLTFIPLFFVISFSWSINNAFGVGGRIEAQDFKTFN